MMHYNSVFGFDGLGGDRFKGRESKPLEKAPVKLEPHHIQAAETVLSKGDRVELIPVKDGVKVMRVRREEVKENGMG